MRSCLFLILCLCLILTATSISGCTGSSEKILFVGPDLVDCTGVGPMKCLQIKEKPEDNWTLLYGEIEGFDHQEGYEYKLLVREQVIDNPPADASRIRLSLIKELSKTPAG
jgi:hypothetical protein